MQLHSFAKLAAGVAALLLAPATASALTVSYQNAGNIFGSNGHTAAKIDSLADPDVTLNVQAGGFALRGDLDGDTVWEDFTAFCLDISTYIANNKNYEITTAPFTDDPLTGVQIGNIGKLFDTAFADLDLTDNNESAGFQLALWEIIYELPANGFSLASGNFKVTNSSAIGFATTLLGGLGGPATGHYALTFLEASPHSSQNLVTASQVPLPAAGLLLAGALGGLGLARRRRRAA